MKIPDASDGWKAQLIYPCSEAKLGACAFFGVVGRARFDLLIVHCEVCRAHERLAVLTALPGDETDARRWDEIRAEPQARVTYRLAHPQKHCLDVSFVSVPEKNEKFV